MTKMAKKLIYFIGERFLMMVNCVKNILVYLLGINQNVFDNILISFWDIYFVPITIDIVLPTAWSGIDSLSRTIIISIRAVVFGSASVV